MNKCIREVDTLARVGGDEFFIILEDIENEESVAIIAQRIISILEKPFFIDDHEARIGSSIGIAFFPNDARDMETLIRNADIALYRVKEMGRNGYKFFTRAMDNQIREKVTLCNLLHGALEREELYLVYQPIVGIRNNNIVGVEALLRWFHPSIGTISPNIFIPLIEEIGLIGNIGEWVLRQACLQGVQWQKKGLAPIFISVNFSPLQFRDRHLTSKVKEILRETGLSPEMLEVEITEGLFREDHDLVADALSKLKAYGIRQIVMDDFGTGYSSLSYLKQFPIDGIKIDHSFIKDFMNDPSNATLLNAITAMALGLNLTSIVAEGVEEQAQIPILRQMGCNYYQGFLFSQPLKSDEIEKILSGISPDIPRQENREQNHHSVSKTHILVAEDYPTNQMALKRHLKSRGYFVDLVDDGLKAVEALKRKNYDLILMDIQMPIMNGYEATKIIRNIESSLNNESSGSKNRPKKKVPIIAITAFSSSEKKTDYIEAGFNDLAIKPINKKELFRLAEYWIST
jgi:predicted signal transduction protein with EAL and GGDEF domain/ActR/RegA family two-component response regulator